MLDAKSNILISELVLILIIENNRLYSSAVQIDIC